jgi:very-short-patch-repair endonuclease
MGEHGERRSVLFDGTPTDENHRVGVQRRSDGVQGATTDEIQRERRLAAIATRQDGLVARPQLIALGFTRREIERRIKSGSLIVLFRGVYAVGHRALSDRAWMRAALMTTGADALLAGSTAARAYALVQALARPLHVLVPGRVPRSRPGLRVHTVRALDPRDRRIHDDLPLTSPARTLLDLAATEPPGVLAGAVREARVRWNVDQSDLDAAIDRAGSRHPGIRRLRAAIDDCEAAPTRSQLERAMLRLIDEAGLPRPVVNRIDGREIVDFTWPDQRVVVEVDGWHAHGDRRAFEDDRARDAARQARGDLVVRFTWRQVTGERVRVATRLAQTLAARAA